MANQARVLPCAIQVHPIVFISIVLVGIAGLSVRTANATLFTLMDQNSSLNIETFAQATGFDWIVDGVDHLTELSNWFRVGPAGSEASVHTLTIQSEILKDLHGDANNDTLTVRYAGPSNQFTITIDYSVVGGALGSGFSGLDEEIRIMNNSFTTDLEFHLFEYVDLDLYETPNDDTIVLTSGGFSPGTLEQDDSLTDTDWFFDADHLEVDNPPNTLSHLTDFGPSTLNDVSGPLGPANGTWALQWDFDGIARPLIMPREIVTITKEGRLQMQFVPEPSTWILVTLAALLISSPVRESV